MPTHGQRSTYTHGCRCGPCTEANSVFQAERQRGGQVPPGGEHGLSGYNNYGCRCLICTKAKQDANAAWSAAHGPRIARPVLAGESAGEPRAITASRPGRSGSACG